MLPISVWLNCINIENVDKPKDLFTVDPCSKDNDGCASTLTCALLNIESFDLGNTNKS